MPPDPKLRMEPRITYFRFHYGFSLHKAKENLAQNLYFTLRGIFRSKVTYWSAAG